MPEIRIYDIEAGQAAAQPQIRVYDITAQSTPAAIRVYDITSVATPSTAQAKIRVYDITASAASGSAPVADAGPDQDTIEPWAIVHVDGSASFDPGGSALTHLWEQISGVAVTLIDDDTAYPWFEAPATIEGTRVGLQLTVTNDDDLIGTDTVEIAVMFAPYQALIDGVWVPIRRVLVSTTATEFGAGEFGTGTFGE